MTTTVHRKARRTAFAIAGLGGNNAYGAGFLAAVQESTKRRGITSGILPGLEMITCTSGAIASTATYLEGGDLRAQVQRGVDAVDRATWLPREAWADPLRLSIITGWTGLPGIFGSYLRAVAEHVQGEWMSALKAGRPLVPTPESLVDTVLPARMFIPERADAEFERWERIFNEASIGVAFNSFDPAMGEESLYVNAVGMDLIREHHDPHARYGGERKRSIYRPITVDGLKKALWLLWYGFENPGQHIDGCYARSIILNELTFADRIYAVKPINDRWIGELPTNTYEVLDLQTELWMGTSYRQQRHQITLVNHLVAEGRLRPPTGAQKKYHPVEVVPVEIEAQRGFFTYFVEGMDVFDAALHQGLQRLQEDDEEEVMVDASERDRQIVQVLLERKDWIFDPMPDDVRRHLSDEAVRALQRVTLERVAGELDVAERALGLDVELIQVRKRAVARALEILDT